MGNEGLTVEALMKLDSILLGFFRQAMSKDAQNQDGLGLNLVRACSEAVTTAVGKVLNE